MTAVSAKWPVQVIFDGQSLNNIPVPPNDYPAALMNGRNIPGVVLAQGGYPWLWLASDANHQTELQIHPTIANNSIWIGCGGQSDLAGITNFLAPANASTVYGRMRDYGQAMTALGYTHVFITTIPSAPGLFDSSMETQRQALNVLLLANADNAFDEVIDIGNPSLSGDGIHPNNAGAIAIASAVAPYLNAVL